MKKKTEKILSHKQSCPRVDELPQEKNKQIGLECKKAHCTWPWLNSVSLSRTIFL